MLVRSSPSRSLVTLFTLLALFLATGVVPAAAQTDSNPVNDLAPGCGDRPRTGTTT